MANKYSGVYTGFRPWGVVKRARLYAVQTAPTINISCGDLVASDNGFIASPMLGAVPYLYDAAVLSATPGDEYLLLGTVLAVFDEKMNPVQYIAAATVGDSTVAGYVLVADHPGQQFEAVVDAALTLADMDLFYSFSGSSLYAPNSYTYMSAQFITATSPNTTSTIPLRLVGQVTPEDSYALAGCRMICQIQPACHQYGATTAL